MSESDTTSDTSKTHYSIAEAARLKGVHPNTVRKYIRQGRIKADMVHGPYGVEYAIPETELDSLGVPVIDTSQGLTLTESGSLPRYLDTLTQVFQTALAELQASHEQALTAKDETITLLTTRLHDLEQQVKLLSAPTWEIPKSDDPTPTCNRCKSDDAPLEADAEIPHLSETANRSAQPENAAHSASYERESRPWWRRWLGW